MCAARARREQVIDWSSLPEELRGLQPAIEKYGQRPVWRHGRRSSVDEYPVEDIDELSDVYRELKQTNALDVLARSTEAKGLDAGLQRCLTNLCGTFYELATKRVAPFRDFVDVFPPKRNTAFDWSTLPAELSYLTAPVERFHEHASRVEVGLLMKPMMCLAPDAMATLADVAHRVRVQKDYTERIVKWVLAHPKDTEAAAVMSLFALLDHLDLDFE